MADLHASNISIVDEAETPLSPSSPKTTKNLLQAAALGLALAFGLAFLLEHIDGTLKFPEEAQRYLGASNLAVIPDFSFTGMTPVGRRRATARQALENGSKHSTELVATGGQYSALSESYRSLRTALLLSRAGSHPKVTLITSALPREGKTNVAINTAIVLAHTGAKVLLVDADLRKPRCHKVLAIKNHFGLTEMLTGSANEEAITKTSIDNLSLLSSGTIPPSPTELLGSTRMREILDSLSQLYDYIIVDSPPVMVVSDAIVLSVIADGVILVAEGGKTPKQDARAAIFRLRQANARIFGFVLNKVRIHKSDYPYYYHSESYGQYCNDGIEDEVEETTQASHLDA